jgi:hypothetical protein
MRIKAHAVLQAQRIGVILRMTLLLFVVVAVGVSICEHRLFYNLLPPLWDVVEFLVPHPWFSLSFTTMEHLPAGEAGSVFKIWGNLVAHVHYFDLLDMSGDSCCHHGFIFDRIEGAGRIDESSSMFEQLEASFQYIELKRMVGMTHVVMEVLPQAIVLPECSISTARHIAQNPVEFENILLVVDSEVW